MSWEVINQILGLATIDKEFVQALLNDPLVAIQERGFLLSSKEQKVLSRISASDLRELSQRLIQELKPDEADGD